MIWAHAGTMARLLGGMAVAVLVFAAAPPARGAPLVEGNAAFERGDFQTAYRVWQPLAEAGDARAQFNLGLLYDTGRGVRRDIDQAVFWLERAAQQGLSEARHNLGLIYLSAERGPLDYAKALGYLQPAAEAGFARSLYTLGKMYEYGLGVAQDDVQMVELVRLAAEAGFDRAQYNMGKFYRDGRGGLVPDAVRSAEWFRRAAEQGYAKAQRHLGARYAAGAGVPQDPVAAYVWTALAARHDLLSATGNLSDLRGALTPVQIAEADRRIAAWTPTR